MPGPHIRTHEGARESRSLAPSSTPYLATPSLPNDTPHKQSAPRSLSPWLVMLALPLLSGVLPYC
jgi:hypothetical protein